MGLVFKMYANESKGAKLPSIEMKLGDAVDCDNPAYPVTGQPPRFFTAPRLRDLYPEYLTDGKVLLCPSSATASVDKLSSAATGELTFYRNCQSTQEGVALMDDSYHYYGYLLDKAGNNPDELFDASSLLLKPSPAMASRQVGAFVADLSYGFVGGAGYEDEFIQSDGDWEFSSTVLSIVGSTDFCGTGATNTLYHLREGIERFLITDINNAAASAQAQSTVFVMWDKLSTVPAAYNHVPGGSNVLYLDGHVGFEKYPGQPPVNAATAIFTGAFD